MKALIILFLLVMTTFLFSREMIENGEFDNGFSGWSQWKISDDVRYYTFIDSSGLLSGPNSARFEFDFGSTVDGHIQFAHACPIQKKTKYYIQFMAGYESVAETYNVPFAIYSPVDPWPTYFFLNPEITDFEEAGPYIFESDTTNSTTTLVFRLGGTQESVLWLDAVSVLEEGPFWQNHTFEDINDAAILKFDVFPDSTFSGIIGFSNNPASAIDDLAGALKFNPDGKITVADGATFRSDAAFEYKYNTRHAVTIEANVSKQHYSVSIKPLGESEVVIASNYAFKNEVSTINNLVAHVDIDPTNGGRPLSSMSVKNLKVTPTANVNSKRVAAPVAFELENYPNPFNPTTTIRYSFDKTDNIDLAVYDLRGRRISTLVNEIQTAGSYEVKFNAENLPSGFYFCQLLVGNNLVQHKRMVLLR